MTTAVQPEIKITHEDGGKWILDYQPVDEAGNAIGPARHIEADTQQEMIEKQAQEHIKAVQTVQARRKKPTNFDPAPAPVQPKVPTADDNTRLVVALQDPAQAREAIQTAVGYEKIKATDERVQILQIQLIGQQFQNIHYPDYYPTEDNGKILMDYLNENQMAYTLKNLNIAYDVLKDTLVQRPSVTPIETPAAGGVPPARQRSATSGLIPGQGTLPRPSGAAPGLTWADVDTLTYDELKEKQRDPKWNAAYMNLCATSSRSSKRR